MLKNCVKILDIYVWILKIAMFRIEGTLDGKTAGKSVKNLDIYMKNLKFLLKYLNFLGKRS